MREKKAHADCNGSIVDNCFREYYLITDDKNKYKLNRYMHSIKQEMNNEVVTKGIVTLNLIERINKLYKRVTGGRITIHIDNKMIIKNIVWIKTKLS